MAAQERAGFRLSGTSLDSPVPRTDPGMTEGRSRSSVLSRLRVKPRACSRFLPSRPAHPSPPLQPSKTSAPGCPAHARPWEPPSILAGALRGGEDSPHAAVTDLVAQRLGGCPAAPRGTGTWVGPSGSSSGAGGRTWCSGGRRRVESRRRQAGDSWGLPRPGPGTRCPDPSLRAAAPRLGLRQTPPGRVWGGNTQARMHTHHHSPKACEQQLS